MNAPQILDVSEKETEIKRKIENAVALIITCLIILKQYHYSPQAQ